MTDEVMDKSEKYKALMDTAGIGPQQLLAYTQTQVQNCVENVIICVRKLLHGKLRSDVRLNINDEAAKTIKAVQQRKLTTDRSTASILLQCKLATSTGWHNIYRHYPDTRQTNLGAYRILHLSTTTQTLSIPS